uniref:Uncharacterized protein n=1 Tax=Cacopsylla melanoneura TaxID=428564 RepID=A0A8D9BRD8_9HEMI
MTIRRFLSDTGNTVWRGSTHTIGSNRNSVLLANKMQSRGKRPQNWTDKSHDPAAPTPPVIPSFMSQTSPESETVESVLRLNGLSFSLLVSCKVCMRDCWTCFETKESRYSLL